jgi:hypothetical protein
MFGKLDHCSQAEAIEAAAVQTAAQTPSDDNKIISPRASLVSVKAALHRDLWDCNGQCGSLRSSTEQAHCDM